MELNKLYEMKGSLITELEKKGELLKQVNFEIDQKLQEINTPQKTSTEVKKE
jgi:hypothetical protein